MSATRRPTRRSVLGAGALGLAGAGAGAAVLSRTAPGGVPGVGGTTAGAAAPPSATAAPAPPTGGVGSTAAEAGPDVAHRWAGHYLAIVLQSGIPAPAAAQMLAELGVVLWSAAHAGRVTGITEGRGAGALHALELPELRRGADPSLVADVALSWLLTRRYADSAGPALVAAAADAERSLEQAAPALRGPARDAGEAVGGAVLDWFVRELVPTTTTPVPRAGPPGPGSWVPTPPDYEQPVLPYWGSTPTLALDEVVTPADPPEFSTDPGSERHALAVEVHDTVAALSEDQLAVARHWSDGKWTVNPAGHWLRIATTLVAERDADLGVAAEALLRLGVSQHDAFVSCWHTKYRTDVLRPITYVRAHLGLPEWSSPVPTPCFPEFTSGHSTQSAAAATALAGVLGDGPFTDATEPSRPPRSYPSLMAAAREAAVSRLYGGIHFANSNAEGLVCGEAIGAAVRDLPLRA